MSSERQQFVRELEKHTYGRYQWKLWVWFFGEVIVALALAYFLFIFRR